MGGRTHKSALMPPMWQPPPPHTHTPAPIDHAAGLGDAAAVWLVGHTGAAAAAAALCGTAAASLDSAVQVALQVETNTKEQMKHATQLLEEGWQTLVLPQPR